MQRLNGNAPGITLLITFAALLLSAGGWVYQLRANELEIQSIKRDYVRKDVLDARLSALDESTRDLKSEICKLREYLLEHSK
jgi:hypothetical protein